MVTQRIFDLMQLEAQIKILKMVEEWRRQMLGGRFVQQAPQQISQQLGESMMGAAPSSGGYR